LAALLAGPRALGFAGKVMAFIILLQVAIPLLLLLGWLWWRPLSGGLGLGLQVAATGLLILALSLAGLWLTLPRWLTWVYAALLAIGAVRARRGLNWRQLPARRAWPALALLIGVGFYAAANIAQALAGRAPPADIVVDLAPPLQGEGLRVANGGATGIVNAHLMTLDPGVPRFRAYRGQSYGVDIVRVNGAGRTSTGLRPTDPARYEIFGDPVLAPCAGRVIAARADRPDMPVPEADRSYLLGNHVVIACGGAHVVLAHFRRNGLSVTAGQDVRVGQLLGEVGNSGNSDEPHLHIHAQRPGSAAEPIAGEPLPIRIGGRYLARNDRL
jgi:hypothetical protein